MTEKEKETALKFTLKSAFDYGQNLYTNLLASGSTPFHTHEDFFEFFYVVSGKAEHSLEGRTEEISVGDAYLLRPGDCHKMRHVPQDNGVRYSHRDVYISVEKMKGFCRFAAPDHDLYSDIVNAPMVPKFHLTYHDVRAAEAQAIHLSSTSDAKTILCYRALVLNLLSLCMTNAATAQYPQWLNKLLAYINASVTRKRDLSEYVISTGYCHRHVNREFKHYTGYRLNEYILRTRLEYAKTLLSEGGNSLSEITYFLGFSSESNFIAAFKKLYGITPLQWKKTEKKGKSISELSIEVQHF